MRSDGKIHIRSEDITGMSLPKETIPVVGVVSLGMLLIGLFGVINPINSSFITSNDFLFVMTTVAGGTGCATFSLLIFILRDHVFSDRDPSQTPPY